jgi:hypothetical protein
LYLQFHGLDQGNRFGTKRTLSALMEFPKKAFICCNKLAFGVDSQGKVHTIASGWLNSEADPTVRCALASSETTPPYGRTEFLALKNRLTEARQVEDSLNFVSELRVPYSMLV